MSKQQEGKQLLQDILDNLNKSGEAFFTQFEGGNQDSDKRVANNHYYAGLAYEGLGDLNKAKEEYNRALMLNPSHTWAHAHLNALK